MRYFAIAALCLFLCFGLTSSRAQQPDYPALKAEAEKLYAAGSYARAYELYKQADALTLPPDEARWVDFRVTDTLWRAQAGTQTADSTKYDAARRQLEGLIRDAQRAEDRDRVWAEVHESLGDFWWLRPDAKNWGTAWAHYQQALDWWAGSRDLEMARQRYLKIIRTAGRPSWAEPYYYYGYYGNYLPLNVLENALKIAATEDDKAFAHYLVAMTLRYQGDQEQRSRAPEEFEAAIRPGKATDWHDDALYYYAEWMMNYGRIAQRDDGGWEQQPDYVKALELLRRLVSDYRKGETRYYDQAQEQIKNLTRPTVGVSVSNIFLPGSEVRYHLAWRNLKSLDLALYRVDLINDVRLARGEDSAGIWLSTINLVGREKIKAWIKQTDDKGDHRPGNESARLDAKLTPGAYVIEARGQGVSARDLILVSDASLVLKASKRQALVYFCDALSGAPVAGAAVKLWAYTYVGNRYVWREQAKQTGQDGICVFDIADSQSHVQLFAAAAVGDRQAFSNGHAYVYGRNELPWRVYAFTDRPAYRPGDTAQWKFVARRYAEGIYATPANQRIEFEITDPRGAKVKEDKATLNAFGSAWGSLPLTEAMPLGEYRVTFWDEGRRNGIGNAVLFRLEEYKLPEFKVSVQTPEERGRKKAFRLGEKVEVNVQADYYFGGSVANATVEVLVHQNPFYHWYHPARDYAWYYEDMTPQRYAYGAGRGQVIKRETLKTDAQGRVKLNFDTPRGAGQDFEYFIEARVTDASRREITGGGTVRVTRQRYYVYPRPAHYLYRPQDKVSVDIKALDANDQPVEAEGAVTLTRDYWVEIWVAPDGREVKGDELRRLRERSKIFPPQVPAGRPGWRLKFRGYGQDKISTQTVKTDAAGAAQFSFTPEREGYYRVAWSSPQKGGPIINAQTTVWVATTASTEIGYRHGGVEIIVDKDTFRAGQRAPVMLTAPAPDRYVLFSVEGDDLYSYQLVHLTGTVKLLELDIRDHHVPNIFLRAVAVSDRQIFEDTKQVVVPPTRHFLSVEVKADREQYQPREEATLTVTTRDHEGKPVAAEVALGMADESVYYIQQDYAGDPRRFYFGQKRALAVQTQSTFQQKSYAKLVETDEKQLIDVSERGRNEVGAKDDERSYDRQALWGDLQSGQRKREAQEYRARADITTEGKSANLPINGRDAAEAARLQPGFIGGMGKEKKVSPGDAGEAGQEPAVQVRSDFRATALWQPDLATDADGTATVKVKFPDSLTTWKATARAITSGSQFGIADAAARTNQPLIVRLQAPRFFVVGDKVTVSAVINNNTDAPLRVNARLDAAGVTVESAATRGTNGAAGNGHADAIEVPANGEQRVDWEVAADRPGEVKLIVAALNGKYTDAMERNYAAYEHGVEKLVARSGKARGNDVTVRLDLPRERKAGTTALTVQVAPSMAVTMLDALPYLINYPYGCTEQTMSRFLPAAITAKTLRDLGLRPEAAMSKVFGGIVREHADKTHPGGKPDLAKLDDMIKKGLKRLYDFQHSDGGWGWWKEGESDHFMTAYVVWGLTLARDADIKVEDDVLKRGVEFLNKELVEQETHYDMQAWMLHAMAVYHASAKQGEVGEFPAKAFDNLWTNRDRLNAYTRALLTLSAHYFGNAERARTLVQNLENGVKEDRAPDTSVIERGGPSAAATVIGTAHWGEDGIYWRWSDGGVEATAFALRALLTVDPKNRLVEPVTNWLIKNRRGAQWSNTRDTAITVLALNDYLRRSGELQPNLEYELLVNGQTVTTAKLSAEDALSAPSQFVIDAQLIRDGANDIRIRRQGGDGPLYFAAEARFFSQEEPVTPAGNEIFVRRDYYRLVPCPTLLKGYEYEKRLLQAGEAVQSGDRIEAVITIEGKNNYEYLLFEDLKPAGFEAVEVRSGGPVHAAELKSGAVARKVGERVGSQEPADLTGRTRWVYQELRDRKVALFIDKLPEGVWQIRYELRAETPGVFHALPVLGHAMYVPEIRANGAEAQIKVEDK